MKIRLRLVLWFSATLLAGMTAMGLWCYYDFVVEPRGKVTRPAVAPDPANAEETDETTPVDLAEILLWTGLPALALSVGGGWWLMRRTLAPVADLTAAAERINEHRLAERLQRSGNGDELDRLTEVFNGMTARLESAFGRLREFTLHASHELKTPLTVLHGEFETWLQDEKLAPARRERIEVALDEVQRLTKIVDGLTLLTRAGAGQVDLKREDVRLDELVREAWTDAQSLGRPAGVEVRLGPCATATLNGDRHRLRQLLLNLCDNAVKYNRRNGTVDLELSLSSDGHAAIICIANTGPGIPPEMLPRVFEPFFRGDASHSQAIDGCGLGLSIVHWIVQAHAGTIDIRSVPGQLTTVSVTLPLAGTTTTTKNTLP